MNSHGIQYAVYWKQIWMSGQYAVESSVKANPRAREVARFPSKRRASVQPFCQAPVGAGRI